RRSNIGMPDGGRMTGNRSVPPEVQVRAMKVRHVQVPARPAAQKCEHAEGKTHGETNQVKICPRHWTRLPSALRRLRWVRAASGSSASSKRSASPGVSRI